MPDRPYTDDDLRAEAVLLGNALSRTPSVADLLCSLVDQYVPSRRAEDGTGPAYGELLDADGLLALARGVHERITGAADTSEWAVRLGEAGLTPHTPMAWSGTTTGWELAVQVATTPELTDEARDELLREIRKSVDTTVKRVLKAKPA